MIVLPALVLGFRPADAVQSQPAIPIEPLPPGARVETVLEGMYNPVAMAFDPEGRIFYTERDTGKVRLFADGKLQDSPVMTFAVERADERGLLGITVDPYFAANHLVYVYYICATDIEDCPTPESRVVRFEEHDGVGSNPAIIFTSPNAAEKHVSGGIHFGPDGKLFISIGDNLYEENAQDLAVKQGKIHRINQDGSMPDDNPSFNQTEVIPSIYAYGFRNSFDFTFDPLVPGRIFAAENGPYCDDELNRVEAGYNYGWRPEYPCDDNNPDPAFNTIPPFFYLGEEPCCEAPTGVAVYTGDQIPQWKNHLFMSSYNNGTLYHFVLDGSRTTALSVGIVGDAKANMTIVNGPDGALYYIEGGAYQSGTLKRIVGGGAEPTPTSTATLAPTATSTATPSVPTAEPSIPGNDSQTFPETGKTVSGIFLDYWERNGGLLQQGYPISGLLNEVSDLDGKVYTVQYFERAVFEYHPEIADTTYKVLLSQLGTFQYKLKYPDAAPEQKPNDEADAVLFSETGKHVGGVFLTYWHEHGGLAQIGFPISEEFTEVSPLNGKPYLVQYFERAVFEYHPKKAGTQFEVLLSQLGTFEYRGKYGQ
ncbi:MAG TPA: PQQ-dependent sugar dehydrogenase [Chloroflexia bacterium]|nr:PQQ-dependent sugar dehydrogenase [Chloroflexia bacterium]